MAEAFGPVSNQPFGSWHWRSSFQHALSNNWAVKADALYYDLATKRITGADPVGGPTYDVASSGEMIRLGFNYKL